MFPTTLIELYTRSSNICIVCIVLTIVLYCIVLCCCVFCVVFFEPNTTSLFYEIRPNSTLNSRKRVHSP